MKFISLYSGSKGNASVILSDSGTALLLDCGVSFLKIKKALAAADVDPQALQGIVITHEHTDHVCGLATLLRHWDLPVYCNRRTALALPYISEHVIIGGNGEFTVGDIRVRRFSTYHDAAEPCGYCFWADGKKVAALTDCGQVDSVIFTQIEGCDMLYIEANYDETMLAACNYPYHLQCRIRSERGHLSNTVCADTVVKLCFLGLQKVLLGHVSENSNTYMMAAATTTEPLRRLGLPVSVEVADESDMPTVVEV
ncbi:MAG: MBL fold metallo-hydrolase [Clostridia bacterium]|nr:MBL fold metallo-hydrolase [Clostridia bacterium]